MRPPGSVIGSSEMQQHIPKHRLQTRHGNVLREHHHLMFFLALRYILGGLLAVLLALFFRADCDLYLYLASYDPALRPFKGKVVWIVGASSGIGAALAQALALAGAKVVLSARREAHLKEVGAACAQLGAEPLIVPLDVLDAASATAAFLRVVTETGGIDSIVLNAGKVGNIVSPSQFKPVIAGLAWSGGRNEPRGCPRPH
jgi:hypothetical protein